jgi:hypothetical protein
MDSRIPTPAWMPQPRPTVTPTIAPDPTLDVMDGSQVIQVTTLFGDSVINVHHLTDPASGRVHATTWVLLAGGWGTFLAGTVLMLVGQLGMATMALLGGLSLGVVGALRWRDERRSPHFTIGDGEKADVPMARELLPAATLPLVCSSGRDYALLFGAQMTGDVTVGAQRTSLGALAASGLAQPCGACPGAYTFPIPDSARIKVDVGETTFLVNAVAPARALQSTMLGRVDWPTQVFNGLSCATHVFLLFLVFSIPPSGRQLNADLFDTSSKHVKYLLRAPEVNNEVPTWLRKNSLDQPSGKSGAAAKGPEGKMGVPKPKHRGGRVALAGNQPNLQLARRLAMEQAKHTGVLGLLNAQQGGALASIFSHHTQAIGSDAETAIGGLIGDHTGEDYGVGGLGLSNTGRGGGGTADEAIGMGGPLGTIGRGNGGDGTWGYGRCKGSLCGLKKPRRSGGPEPRAEGVRVKGSLDKEIIRRVIRTHLNEVRYCYQKELNAKPDLDGRIVVRFTIAQTGQVVISKVDQSSLSDTNVESCLTQATLRWTFPRPENGIVVVTYPFLFHTPKGQ